MLVYDASLDDKPMKQQPIWKPKRSATGLPKGPPPSQEVMPETLGAKDDESATSVVIQTNMISTEL